MLKPIRLRSIFGVLLIMMLAIMAAQAIITGLFFNTTLCIIELIVVALSCVIISIYFLTNQRRSVKFLNTIIDQLSSESNVLTKLSIPVMSVKDSKIEWYNAAFRNRVIEKKDCLNRDCGFIIDINTIEKVEFGNIPIEYNGRQYTCCFCQSEAGCYICYFIDQTEFSKLSEKYDMSCPVVALVAVDNLDELQKNIRDSEKAQLSGIIEKQIENWASDAHGICRKLSYDRFIMVTEERYLQKMIESRFDILNKVRAVDFGELGSATLSIGIGHGGENFIKCEDFARQALDMALGRGGDQVAVKGLKDFEFFGGTSGAVAKRTRVRTRVVASALKEISESSDNVLIMGHRFSDLDCFGAAYGIYGALKSMGKSANIVVSREKSLCTNLIDYIEQNGGEGATISPLDAMNMVTRKTLLIIVDTHRRSFLESPELFDAVDTVVVIDHHRKTVDHIDKAVIFYQEPYASSTCEMVSELLQYMGQKVERIEADALLAGIMLDTRNFVLHTGVRTFEASAYLRSCGANPVIVKQFFRSNMDVYKERAEIVASTKIYGDCAISMTSSVDEGVRIACAQAADEMLGIEGVNASFVIFSSGGIVNISARSLGVINVQLIMEHLGGGGHLTMAAAQLADIDIDSVMQRLMVAIDVYRQNVSK